MNGFTKNAGAKLEKTLAKKVEEATNFSDAWFGKTSKIDARKLKDDHNKSYANSQLNQIASDFQFMTTLDKDYTEYPTVKVLRERLGILKGYHATIWPESGIGDHGEPGLPERLNAGLTELAEAVTKEANRLKAAEEAEDKAAMEDAIGAKEFLARITAANLQFNAIPAERPPLSDAEIVAIRTYTLICPDEGNTLKEDAEYVEMNKLSRNDRKILRNKGELLAKVTGDVSKIREKNRIIDKALRKLPSFGATPTYRLDRYFDAWLAMWEGLTIGGLYCPDTVWSTGTTGTIDAAGATSIIHWTVTGIDGKAIEDMSKAKGMAFETAKKSNKPPVVEGGGEVLYRAGATFKVTDRSLGFLDDDESTGVTLYKLAVTEVPP
jgi:hypothetical protein